MVWGALVGEAYGAEEEKAGKPFVGAAGLILNACLASAGIKRSDCLVTNVFNLRPTNNKLESILVPKKQAAPGWSPARHGRYLPEPLIPELERLYRELREAQPKVIIALGGTALWALSGSYALAPHRGHLHYWEGIPMIPTHHPARVLRQYPLKHLLVADLVKAKELTEGKIQPAILDYIPEPTLDQVKAFTRKAKDLGICSVDIENLRHTRAITCCGLGTPDQSICIPFFHEEKQGYSYWGSAQEELEALLELKKLLEDASVGKIFHHMVHDIPWLAEVLGICVRGAVHDTRLMHAVMFGELPHSLSDVTANWFLFPPWKAQWKSAKDNDVSESEGESE